jgi:Transposase DDE domain
LAAEPRTTRGGQPFYSPLAILTALTFRAEFHLAYRHAEGLIGSIISLLGLKLRVSDHTTFSRRSAALPVPQLPPDNTDVGNDAQPLHLLVDSTSLKLCGAGEWLVEKRGTRTRPSWRKLHLGVEADTGQIVATALTGKEVDDAVQVGRLLDQLTGVVSSVAADGAYDQDGVYADVARPSP